MIQTNKMNKSKAVKLFLLKKIAFLFHRKHFIPKRIFLHFWWTNKYVSILMLCGREQNSISTYLNASKRVFMKKVPPRIYAKNAKNSNVQNAVVSSNLWVFPKKQNNSILFEISTFLPKMNKRKWIVKKSINLTNDNSKKKLVI